MGQGFLSNGVKIYVLVLVLLLGSAQAISLSEKSSYDRELSFVREIFNFHVVKPNIMRGSQPTIAAIGLLKRYCGVKTILNLRGEVNLLNQEEAYAKKFGIKYINIPMDALRAQSTAKIEKCIDIINDKANQPIFVHCQVGKDRAGLIFAAYRIKYDNWSLEDALMEMLVYGYNRVLFPKLEESLRKWNDWRKTQPVAADRLSLAE